MLLAWKNDKQLKMLVIIAIKHYMHAFICHMMYNMMYN